MSGEDEAAANQARECLKIHRSTLRKLNIMESVIHRADAGDLKVNVGPAKIYGLSVNGIAEIVKNNRVIAFVVAVIIYLLQAAREPVVQRIFGTSS